MVAVDPTGAIRDIWMGLTLDTALATAPVAALYALEKATGSDPNDPGSIAPGSGRVVCMSEAQDGEIVAVGISFPVATEFGADGALFVLSPDFGADTGEREIHRLDLSAGMPLDVSAVELALPCP